MQAVSTLNLRSAHGGWGSDYLFLEDEEAAPHIPCPISPPTCEGGSGREVWTLLAAYPLQWPARAHVNGVPSAWNPWLSPSAGV